MAKYHVKSDGEFGVCKAYKGKCPLVKDGEDVMHVSSKAEAQQLSENILAIKFERKEKSLSKKSGKEVKDNAAVGVDKMSEEERRDYLKSFDGSVNSFGEKAVWDDKVGMGALVWEAKGHISRSDGPAIEHSDGSKEWYRDGKLNRDDGPAIEDFDGTKEWWVNGLKHREDGPAVVDAEGSKSWYINGKLHRVGGPAVEEADGYKAWYQNGELHRVGGPAVIDADGSKEWYINGKEYSKDGTVIEDVAVNQIW